MEGSPVKVFRTVWLNVAFKDMRIYLGIKSPPETSILQNSLTPVIVGFK
jgi:hypothetical protein